MVVRMAGSDLGSLVLFKHVRLTDWGVQIPH